MEGLNSLCTDTSTFLFSKMFLWWNSAEFGQYGLSNFCKPLILCGISPSMFNWHPHQAVLFSVQKFVWWFCYLMVMTDCISCSILICLFLNCYRLWRTSQMSSEVSYLSLSPAVQDLHFWALRSVFELFASDCLNCLLLIVWIVRFWWFELFTSDGLNCSLLIVWIVRFWLFELFTSDHLNCSLMIVWIVRFWWFELFTSDCLNCSLLIVWIVRFWLFELFASDCLNCSLLIVWIVCFWLFELFTYDCFNCLLMIVWIVCFWLFELFASDWIVHFLLFELFT